MVGKSAAGPTWSWGPIKSTDANAFARDRRVWAHATDDHSVALGLELGRVTGYAIARTSPGKPLDPIADFNALGLIRLLEGRWVEGQEEPFDRLLEFLDAIRPDFVCFREPPAPTEPKVGQLNWSPLSFAYPTSALFVDMLESTLKRWATQNAVPCHHVSITALRRRFARRAAASTTDLVIALNKQLSTNLDPNGYRTTHVDRLAIAALALIAGLSDRLEGTRTGT